MSPTTRHRWLLRLGLVSAGLLVGFLLAETVARVHTQVTRYDLRAELAKAERSRPPPLEADCRRPARQASLGEITRPSAAPDLVYELKSGLDTCFYEARTFTNA